MWALSLQGAEVVQDATGHRAALPPRHLYFNVVKGGAKVPTRTYPNQRFKSYAMFMLLLFSSGITLATTSGCDVWEALCLMSGDDNDDFDFDEIGDEIEDEFDDEFGD